MTETTEFNIPLPKKYEKWENTPEKYLKYVGHSKLSYSQYTSFKDPEYVKDYILQYFFKMKVFSKFERFAIYGSHCGEHIEWRGEGCPADYTPGELLSDSDIAILNSIDLPENSKFEDEIVFPVRNKEGHILFVIQGFIDRATYSKDNKKVSIIDYKTGNVDKKVEYYSNENYGQTTLYAGCKESEGYKVEYSGVELLGRKGNGYAKSPMRLSGVIKDIPTPYSKTRFNKVIKSMTKSAIEISKLYAVLVKLRENEN